jgi:HSP20 family molecular chaperone IbpA
MSSRDPNDWMWERAAELLERTAWVQRRFFQASCQRGSAWEPPVDVFETTAELFVLVALPGVEAARVEVSCQGDVLLVEARRMLPSECERSEVRRLEIPQGRFQRRIPLPSPRVTLLAREVKDGLLFVRLRKEP